jgi:hypothetical protein
MFSFHVLISGLQGFIILFLSSSETMTFFPLVVSHLFLKCNASRKEEIKYTIEVSKCDKLFDVLVQGGMIKLKEGHIIPTVELLAKRRYCKWHDSYSHTTNECNYFHLSALACVGSHETPI